MNFSSLVIFMDRPVHLWVKQQMDRHGISHCFSLREHRRVVSFLSIDQSC